MLDAGNTAFISKFSDVVKQLDSKRNELDLAMYARPDVGVLQQMVDENTREELNLLIQRQLQLILSDIKIDGLSKTITIFYVDGREPVTISMRSGKILMQSL